jgi:hypothetical protein
MEKGTGQIAQPLGAEILGDVRFGFIRIWIGRTYAGTLCQVNNLSSDPMRAY